MNRDDPAAYGEHIAGVYDAWHQSYDEAAIATLHGLARGGRVLELGIGTGRIAIPLVRRGAEVQGIDASRSMTARLRDKPEGANIPVVIGDFADVAVEGRFSLVLVMFNTFFALHTQEDQVRCFRNVAAHLEPDGVFVIEAFVPDLTRFSGGQALRTTRIGGGEVRLDASLHDPVTQRVTTEHVVLSDKGVRLYPVSIRYAWPAELDLMARLAGLRLAERWGGWGRIPFTAGSSSHISVYARANEEGRSDA